MVNKSLFILFHTQNATHDEKCLEVYIEMEFKSNMKEIKVENSIEIQTDSRVN